MRAFTFSGQGSGRTLENVTRSANSRRTHANVRNKTAINESKRIEKNREVKKADVWAKANREVHHTNLECAHMNYVRT